MAPKKRKAAEEKSAVSAVTPSRVTRSATVGRVTRSMIQEGKAKLASSPLRPVRKTKKAKTSKKTKNAEPEGKPQGSDDKNAQEGKPIIIEHCKQDASFKKKAAEVKARLEQDVSGINVILNPKEPRRGCFEIREDGGEIFISLLDIKRPFKPIKDLVIDEVISDMLGKING